MLGLCWLKKALRNCRAFFFASRFSPSLTGSSKKYFLIPLRGEDEDKLIEIMNV